MVDNTCMYRNNKMNNNSLDCKRATSFSTLSDSQKYQLSRNFNCQGVPIANSHPVTAMSEMDPIANKNNIREVPNSNNTSIREVPIANNRSIREVPIANNCPVTAVSAEFRLQNHLKTYGWRVVSYGKSYWSWSCGSMSKSLHA